MCFRERIKSFGCLRNNMILYPIEFNDSNNISAFRIVHLFYLKAFSDFLNFVDDLDGLEDLHGLDIVDGLNGYLDMCFFLLVLP